MICLDCYVGQPKQLNLQITTQEVTQAFWNPGCDCFPAELFTNVHDINDPMSQDQQTILCSS